MAKVADIRPAIDAYKEEINRDFDAFADVVLRKLDEVKSAQNNGDDAAVDSIIEDLKKDQADFKAKVQGKTDALTPQVAAATGASDAPDLPAAPAPETIPSASVDTIEAGQNPRLGGTLQDQPKTDSVEDGSADTVRPFGNDTVDASAKTGFDSIDTGKDDETLPGGDLANFGGTNTGSDTINQ